MAGSPKAGTPMDGRKLEIRDAGAKGRGLFALEPSTRGLRILAIGGRVFSSAQLPDDLLAMPIGDDLWLCSDGTLLDDMANHSCAPSAGSLEGDAVLYALRDITAGEEIC